MAPYDPASFPPFAVTVDVVILTVRDGQLQVLLVERSEAPYAGEWALPGGFVGVEQDLAAAAQHKLTEKTGLSVDESHLEQLATFGEPSRDPRMRVVSVSYLALVPEPADTGAERASERSAWMPIGSLPTLAFDHQQIVTAGVERARAKLEYTTLATSFCDDEFTIGELRAVYECVWGHELDAANFHRKVLATDEFVVATGELRTQAKGRPAKLYRAGSATELVPPLQR